MSISTPARWRNTAWMWQVEFSVCTWAKAMIDVQASLAGLLAWRCGYATGLRVALQLVREGHDPECRIKRELRVAVTDVREQRESNRDVSIDQNPS